MLPRRCRHGVPHEYILKIIPHPPNLGALFSSMGSRLAGSSSSCFRDWRRSSKVVLLSPPTWELTECNKVQLWLQNRKPSRKYIA